MRETWEASFQLAATMYQLQQVMDDSEPKDYYSSYSTERLKSSQLPVTPSIIKKPPFFQTTAFL